MEFQPGDVVKLKSGGEKMTIETISDGLVDCVWFEDKKVVRNSFEPVTLKKYEPGRGAVMSRSF
jgi:uncharacterized protein YodC (DUF2158 family)